MHLSTARAAEETRRLAALQSHGVLGSAAEGAFDALARIAASVCDTPFAFLSFLGRAEQTFKATVGLDLASQPRDISLCNVVLERRGVVVIPDLREDGALPCAGTLPSPAPCSSGSPRGSRCSPPDLR